MQIRLVESEVWGAVLKAIKNCDVSMAMGEECHPPCKKGYDL